MTVEEATAAAETEAGSETVEEVTAAEEGPAAVGTAEAETAKEAGTWEGGKAAKEALKVGESEAEVEAHRCRKPMDSRTTDHSLQTHVSESLCRTYCSFH